MVQKQVNKRRQAIGEQRATNGFLGSADPKGVGFQQAKIGKDLTAGGRVRCDTMRLNENRLTLAACGPEQTKITLGVTQMIARYPGLNIRGVKTVRTDQDAAMSYFVVSELGGDVRLLDVFALEVAEKPYFLPGGHLVQPQTLVDLTIIAPDRTQLLFNELEIISGEYEVNIETLINSHHDILELKHSHEPEIGGMQRTGLTSITRMRLEVDDPRKTHKLIRDLKLRGKRERWDVRWEEQPLKTETTKRTVAVGNN